MVSQEFKLEDIDVKLPRNKNDNIQTKAQSFSTIMATEVIAPEDALAMADMTTDITGVISRGKKYKDSLVQEGTQNKDDINNLTGDKNTSVEQ